MPTDDRIRSLSPFQSLWLYSHIKKHENEQRKALWDVAKMLAAVINPGIAKEIFKDSKDAELTETVNTNFEADILAIDPEFKFDEYRDMLKD